MSSQLEGAVSWEGSMLGLFYKQLFVSPRPIPPETSLANKTAIITGANTGIGFEAARQLLQLGLSQLIVAVRSEAKGQAACEKLRKEFPAADIQVSLVDMADYDSVTSFADRCRSLARIDYVILNAGTQNSAYQLNESTGHEAVLQINYLSTALLLMLLASVIVEKKKQHNTDHRSVITVVGSDTMYLSTLYTPGPILPYLDDATRFVKMQQYMDSKLLVMMFIAQLAGQVNPRDVVINVCNPGMTAGTGLGPGPSFVERYIVPAFYKALGRSTAAGASIYVHALVAEGEESHGSFVSDWTIKSYAALMYKEEGKSFMERLWQETMEELRFVSSPGFDGLFARV
ncbi:hypothetical protein FZEAL_5167 [Fusarium zealandicum]|uniref:Short-chain dehydrogenase/reductase family protein n=1 Tax=Fusarium zealandicum TaxID=1053134 RepID=A0A8H4XK38_9HYPO|nr:hypothetical protein FZEAL_5167 [Fusarium zealandicum]